MANYILNVENYTTVHLARSGVAFFIRNDIKLSKCVLFQPLNLEICAINVNLNGKEIIVLTYYNPPNMEINEKVFDILSQQKSDYVFMGDLNAKQTNWCATENNTNGNILESILIENDCIVINNKQYTHHNFGGYTSSILDF